MKNRNWTIFYLALLLIPLVPILYFSFTEQPSGTVGQYIYATQSYRYVSFAEASTIGFTAWIIWFAVLTYVLWYKVVQIPD